MPPSTTPDPIARSLTVAATTIQEFKQSPSTKRALFLVQAAQRALDRAQTIEECKDIHDALRLLQVYSQMRHEDWRLGQTFAMQRLISEWRMGEILRRTVRQGGNPERAKFHEGTLPDGISRKDSMNWQRIAELELGNMSLRRI